MKRVILAMIILAALPAGATEAATGAVAAPRVQISPNPITFAVTTIGHQSYSSVTVTNVGTASLTVKGLQVVGPTNGYMGVTTAGCTGVTLQPGAQCEAGLGFSPGDINLYVNWLLIYDNAPGSPQHVRMEGCGEIDGVTCGGKD